jgi:hypothetical protein
MAAIERWFVAWLARLCRLFDVTPESLRNGRRGNLPPPQGGIGS